MEKWKYLIIMCVIAVIFIAGYLLRQKHEDLSVTRRDDSVIDVPIIIGTTYFVSPTGNDAQDGLSKERAFASIQRSFDLMQPGDGVQIMDGVYMQDIATMRNGTKDRPIIIMGSKSAIVHGTGKSSRIMEINHDHITVYGFTIDGLAGELKNVENYRDKLIYVEGREVQEGVEGVRVINMSLKNAGGECIRIKYFSHDNEIAGNTITGCGAYDFLFEGKGKNGEGIYIGTAPEQVKDDKNITRDTDRSNNNWIHDNMIDTQGNECVDVKEGSSFNVIEKNVCTGQKDKESAGLDSRGNDNIFKNNEVYGCVGAGIRLGGDKDQDGINNNVIGNYLHNNSSGGIKIQTKPQGKICENKIKNNKKEDLVGEYGGDMTNEKSC